MQAVEARAWLEDNLALVDAIVAGVCRRASLLGADADDFSACVKLALVENDYATLRAYEGRSALSTYLVIIIERLLLDERTRRLGRWRPSTEATRLGPAAIVIESLIVRDGRSVESALPLVQAVDPSLARRDIESILDRLPRRRVRPIESAIDLATEERVAGHERTDTRALANESRAVSDRATRIVRSTLASFSIEDQSILQFRFAESFSVADIARMLRLPQRRLYRRIDSMLNDFRRALAHEGICADSLESLLATAATEGLDFGLAEISAVCQSKPVTQAVEADQR